MVPAWINWIKRQNNVMIRSPHSFWPGTYKTQEIALVWALTRLMKQHRRPLTITHPRTVSTKHDYTV